MLSYILDCFGKCRQGRAWHVLHESGHPFQEFHLEYVFDAAQTAGPEATSYNIVDFTRWMVALYTFQLALS